MQNCTSAKLYKCTSVIAHVQNCTCVRHRHTFIRNMYTEIHAFIRSIRTEIHTAKPSYACIHVIRYASSCLQANKPSYTCTCMHAHACMCMQLTCACACARCAWRVPVCSLLLLLGRCEGGIGIAARLHGRMAPLLRTALEMATACPCRDGCWCRAHTCPCHPCSG